MSESDANTLDQLDTPWQITEELSDGDEVRLVASSTDSDIDSVATVVDTTLGEETDGTARVAIELRRGDGSLTTIRAQRRGHVATWSGFEDDDGRHVETLQRAPKCATDGGVDVDADTLDRPNYHGPRTLEEWFEHLRENTDQAAFIDAEYDAVFVGWDSDEELWRANSSDPDSGNRGRSYVHENLVTRWFEEGLSTDAVWPMERSEVPI